MSDGRVLSEEECQQKQLAIVEHQLAWTEQQLTERDKTIADLRSDIRDVSRGALRYREQRERYRKHNTIMLSTLKDLRTTGHEIGWTATSKLIDGTIAKVKGGAE